MKRGTWVEIHSIVLKPGERAPGVPVDTESVPLELKVRGFLLRDAVAGETVEVKTRTGRVLSGRLVEDLPVYNHSFGKPPPELLPIGEELKALLKEGDR
jgi:hypothetical protein